MDGLERLWREIAEGRRRDAGALLLIALLWPLSLLYALIMELRALAYRRGLLRVNRLVRPVIAVGNLTVGGTGKTPMVAWLARYCLSRGKRVTVLSRGYGGTVREEPRIVSDGRTIFLTPAEGGDEPCLLAAAVPGLAVVVGADRYRAGLLALEELEPDLFILDDGFQHLRLWRDLNILLVDSRSPFGNGLTLPAGLLREPKGAVGRADLVVRTRCSAAEPLAVAGRPVCRAEHRLTGVTPLKGGALQPFTALAGKRGLAFAGIADPAGFFAALAVAGVTLVATIPLPDHCRYGEAELAVIDRAREVSGAEFLITTAKDGVKLAPYLARLGSTYVAHLEMEILDPEPLQAVLGNLL